MLVYLEAFKLAIIWVHDSLISLIWFFDWQRKVEFRQTQKRGLTTPGTKMWTTCLVREKTPKRRKEPSLVLPLFCHFFVTFLSRFPLIPGYFPCLCFSPGTAVSPLDCFIFPHGPLLWQHGHLDFYMGQNRGWVKLGAFLLFKAKICLCFCSHETPEAVRSPWYIALLRQEHGRAGFCAGQSGGVEQAR